MTQYFCGIAIVGNSLTLFQKMGVIGPNDQLPRRRHGRQRYREALNSARDGYKEGLQLENNLEGDSSKIYEALSLFPQPKSLLTRVIQVATSANRTKVCCVRLYFHDK